MRVYSEHNVDLCSAGLRQCFLVVLAFVYIAIDNACSICSQTPQEGSPVGVDYNNVLIYLVPRDPASRYIHSKLQWSLCSLASQTLENDVVRSFVGRGLQHTWHRFGHVSN